MFYVHKIYISASSAVDKDSEEEMSKMTGGLNIPGLG